MVDEHSTPTPVAPPAPAPLTPSLVSTATAHYHVKQPAAVISSNGKQIYLWDDIRDHYIITNLPCRAVPYIPYYVHVTVAYTVVVPPTGHAKVASTKKDKLMKMESIVLDSITHVNFLKETLKVHNLSSEYSPGTHSGPDFKMSWTGSGYICQYVSSTFNPLTFYSNFTSGRQGGAPTIHNDKDFTVVLEALFAKRGKVQVYVDLNLDTMEGFRIRSMVSYLFTSCCEQSHEQSSRYHLRPSLGLEMRMKSSYMAHVYVHVPFEFLVRWFADQDISQVPKVSNFSKAAQIQGTFIIQLKQKWVCEKHQGEHGEPGHCYVNPLGAHIRLNPRRLKEWAAAWVCIPTSTTSHRLISLTLSLMSGCW